ncbi:hypothetical protein IZY60_04825 [Lutibacter sp. B2]|nr:hypothetical protein [Lutibacter sp. B2]
MKRTMVILLVLTMVISIIQPISVFAENDKGLEKAIKTAKLKINISKEFTKFKYDVDTVEDQKVWNLCWSREDGKNGEVSISVDENGRIVNYDYYQYTNNKDNKLPKYNKEKAKEITEQFINKMDSSLLKQLKLEENDQMKMPVREYRFNYIRNIKDVPYYREGVHVEVNSQTGKVESFRRNWTDQCTFPNSKNIISMNEAQNAFKKELGLELVYKIKYEKERIKPYLVYKTKYEDDYSIDAFTGKKSRDNNLIFAGGAMAKSNAANEDYAQEVSLTPEEQKAVNEASNLISKEKAEIIARNNAILELDKTFVLEHANLNRQWPEKNRFEWSLSFSKKDDKGTYSYVSVRMDAVTEEIRSFYRSDGSKEKEEVKFDKEESQKEVEKFLQSFASDKFKQTIEVKEPEYYISNKEEKPSYYYFKYRRKVNDIPVEDNYIGVRFNAVSGKIQSFDMKWFNTSFEAKENVISLDRIYEKMFAEVGLELNYKEKYTDEKQDKDMKLVYSIKENRPVLFDANKGILLNYNGEPFKEEKQMSYTDIKGHKDEEKINVLSMYGVRFEEDEFKPAENMKQKDFLLLLVQTLNYYYDGNVDEMYDYLMREEIVKESEKSPETVLSKEEGVKFIIRALNYGEVASIQGIYKYPFKDIESASKDLIGHITIANGIGIIDAENGVFSPKDQLTRADGAVMIYNYLQK